MPWQGLRYHSDSSWLSMSSGDMLAWRTSPLWSRLHTTELPNYRQTDRNRSMSDRQIQVNGDVSKAVKIKYRNLKRRNETQMDQNLSLLLWNCIRLHFKIWVLCKTCKLWVTCELCITYELRVTCELWVICKFPITYELWVTCDISATLALSDLVLYCDSSCLGLVLSGFLQLGGEINKVLEITAVNHTDHRIMQTHQPLYNTI